MFTCFKSFRIGFYTEASSDVRLGACCAECVPSRRVLDRRSGLVNGMGCAGADELRGSHPGKHRKVATDRHGWTQVPGRIE